MMTQNAGRDNTNFEEMENRMEKDYDHEIIPWSQTLEIDTADRKCSIPW